MWLKVLIGVIIVGAILGYFASDDDKRGEGALAGGCASGIGCFSLLVDIFFIGLGIWLMIALFSWLFG